MAVSTLALPPDAFRLGALVVVPSLNRLVRGEHTTDIEPRVMNVLATLAESPGEVVTRQALFDTVWAGTVVNDEALTRAVSELRKALGPDARGAVETIRGRGYRLTIPAEPLVSEDAHADQHGRPAPRRARSRRAVVLAALALALAAISLVVSLRSERLGDAAPAQLDADSVRAAREPLRLDSTSQFYMPGASELGVYYDSSAGAYFRLEVGPE